MTDKLNSLTVVLEQDIRDDDAECIIEAIKMIKCVLSVKPHVLSLEDHVAQERVRQELHKKLFNVIYPK